MEKFAKLHFFTDITLEIDELNVFAKLFTIENDLSTTEIQFSKQYKAQ